MFEPAGTVCGCDGLECFAEVFDESAGSPRLRSPQERLHLRPSLLYWIKLGTVGGKKLQACAPLSYGASHLLVSVDLEVVPHDDILRPKTRAQALVHPGAKRHCVLVFIAPGSAIGAPGSTIGASTPVSRRAATTEKFCHRPPGTVSTIRSPLGARALARVRAKFMPLSSMNTSRPTGHRRSQRLKRERANFTSGRSCSAARICFFLQCTPCDGAFSTWWSR